ncbi:MAG: HAMP domain-containing protein [Geobacteraceae bacterium]|nr:HAMP domain-containing protein [Geobacteraceae bacterium]
MKLTLFRKFLLALFLIAILPLILSSATLLFNLSATSGRLAEDITAATDKQASEALQSRARQVAEDVSQFLAQCENDLRLVAAISKDSSTLDSFYQSRKLEIWHRLEKNGQPVEESLFIPVYSSLELIDKKGKQRFVISSGRILPVDELKDISNQANTGFRSEDYFRKTASLKKGKIYVSHLTGFHVSKKEQLRGAQDSETAYGGKEYQGVIRFATPIYGSDNEFEGIIVLSLDHRHLMEFSQHILPGSVEKTLFPSYKSGNYAFIFDDEGWIITHPNYWDIRGLYPDGREVAPYTENTPLALIEAGRIPFNLDRAGFIHPNYPLAAAMARKGESGYLDTTNVGGARKVMAYAPIPYRTGDYRRHGIFGGVTIGFQTDQFHEPAKQAAAVIHNQMQSHLRRSGMILAFTALLSLLAAWRISRSITKPLALLTEKARDLAEGAEGVRVLISSGDEVGELAADFNKMADELEVRNRHILETLSELARSRETVTGERNFMEEVLNSISSAIIPFSPQGEMISINTKGIEILERTPLSGEKYSLIFADWPSLVQRIEETVAGRGEFGRKPDNWKRRCFDVGIFPIGAGMEQGFTVTLRDETEKERMREEMTRMDRFASLGRLSAGIAHEIRNPLTGITLLLDDLHDRADTDPESREMLGRSLEEIERVERLLSSLLSYASPPKSEFYTADLKQTIEETLLFFRKTCEKGGVSLESRIARLPELVFDPDKIRQMLLNLLRNALEATQSGGRITVTLERENESAILTVTDTGQGIPAPDLDHVFEPFFTRSVGGTGLGLSISQRIIEEHHGSIEVRSVEGEGTRFEIRLPLTGT